MQLHWKVHIEQQNLAREYSGQVELDTGGNGHKATFPFHLKLDPGYRITEADNPYLLLFKDGTNYLKIGWPPSQEEYDLLPDEKQVMLQLIGQMVIAGEKKIISEHGLDSPQFSAAVLNAAQSTIMSEKEGAVALEDPVVRQLVQAACQ